MNPVLVIDGYRFGASFLTALQRQKMITAFIDDEAHHPAPVQLLINPNVGGNTLRYRTLPTTQKMLGPAFALLSPYFWSAQKVAVTPLSASSFHSEAVIRRTLCEKSFSGFKIFEERRLKTFRITVVTGPI